MSYPRVALAILAKQKAAVLPFYLQCIEDLDYPKNQIQLFIRTNDSTDQTQPILEEWCRRIGDSYAGITLDATGIDPDLAIIPQHEWTSDRLRVLGMLRQQSIDGAFATGAEFYFVVDVDNYLRPQTLSELVKLNLPVVAPMLAHTSPTSNYSNFHFKTNAHGYRPHDGHIEEENLIRWQVIRGVIQVDCVHCTYLVRRDVAPLLRYDDGSGRHEYVIFSDSARRNGVPQYLDNRIVYGCLDMEENPEPARRWFASDGAIY